MIVLFFKKNKTKSSYTSLIVLKIITLLLFVIFMYTNTINKNWETDWMYLGTKSTIMTAIIIYYLVISHEILIKQEFKFWIITILGLLCFIHSSGYWFLNFYQTGKTSSYSMSPEENHIINMIAYGLLFIAGIAGLILKFRKK